ncbi:MAG: NAD(P)-dependent oxidoreductase [Polyangiaceae bacterium]|nr:NAD(P)-dependent oxidoreductase [Polyangiaceae bacterium]
MRIFVTGGSGFVGSHLVRRWSRDGHQITVLTRDPARSPGLAALPGVSLLAGDLRDPALIAGALPGHDAIVHHALIWGAPEDDLELEDVRAGARLLEAAGAAGVGLAIFTSSTAVHRPFLAEMDETSPVRPADYYAATKAAGELVLGAVARQAGIRYLVVRLAPVIGEPAFVGAPFKCDDRFGAIAQAARAGRDVVVRAGEGLQPIGAAQVAEVYAAALASSLDGVTLIAAASDFITWEAIAQRTVAACGSSSQVVLSDTPPASTYRFDVGRLERTLGLRFLASPLLEAHLAEVARRT